MDADLRSILLRSEAGSIDSTDDFLGSYYQAESCVLDDSPFQIWLKLKGLWVFFGRFSKRCMHERCAKEAWDWVSLHVDCKLPVRAGVIGRTTSYRTLKLVLRSYLHINIVTNRGEGKEKTIEDVEVHRDQPH